MMTERLQPNNFAYRWPAEWEPHRATWLSWPHNRSTWPGCFDLIPPLFARFVQVVAEHEPVVILIGDGVCAEQARILVGNLQNVTLLPWRTNDAWIRDYGPTFLQAIPGQRDMLVHWQYNAWGGKYPPWKLDTQVPRNISQNFDYQRFASPLTLEGGALEGNGDRLLMTTESCVLHRNRNPNSTRSFIERCLLHALNMEQVLWLRGGGIAGDDTDGHIDQLARFVRSNAVVAAVTNDPKDSTYRKLRENLDCLEHFRRLDGSTLQIIPLPLPAPVYHSGTRLPASYCNYYIANELVVVPQFDDPADDPARDLLQTLYPSHHVVGLPARHLIRGLGAFHCLTQQQPCLVGSASRPANRR
ncbi:MAG: agmatine deiminase [Planctomycetaceae bacterium]|nr:agmatine deiminase [Planctomycetaceae bacterium]